MRARLDWRRRCRPPLLVRRISADLALPILAVPSPTSSAIAPPRIAAASSSRVICPRSTRTMRSATSRTRVRGSARRSASRAAALSRSVERTAADLLDDRRLDAFRRFVQDQQPRGGHQRTRQREDLLLAARQRTALAVKQASQFREQSRRRVRSRFPRCLRSPASMPGADSPARSGRPGCRAPGVRSRCLVGSARARASW